jgi:hypothetical protein
MNTTTTETTNAPVIKTAKKETFRVYGYTNKTNNNWIEKNSKSFGSKAKFIDALITAARKNKLEVKAPTIKTAKKVVTKKKATKKLIAKKSK